MLQKLKSKSKGNDMFLSEGAEASYDWLLSFMSEAESGTKELIRYIEEIISKNIKLKLKG